MDNKDLISRIEETFGETRLVGWQFAADGKWADTHVSLQDSIVQPLGRVQDWLVQQTTENIVLEAAFQLTNGESFFFGASMAHLDRADQAFAINQLVIQCEKDSPFREVVRKTRDAFDNQEIAATSPEYLQLYILDEWSAAKPLVVWRKNQHLGALKPVILPMELPWPNKTNSSFHIQQAGPLMLEAVWPEDSGKAQNLPYWVSFLVSQQMVEAPATRILSTPKYERAASCLLNIDLT